MKETSSNKSPSGGMYAQLKIIGDFFQARREQVALKQSPSTSVLTRSKPRKIRILTAHQRRIRETGEATFVYRRFLLIYKRNDGKKRLSLPWTIRPHGFHVDEETKLIEELKEFLSHRGVEMTPVSDSTGQYFQLKF